MKHVIWHSICCLSVWLGCLAGPLSAELLLAEPPPQDEAAEEADSAQAPKKPAAKQAEPNQAEPQKRAAQEAKKPAKSQAEAAKPTTYTVKKGLLKIETTLDGLFEAQQTSEIALRPKTWTTFKVLRAAEHGSRVKRGDLLVALDLEKIDEAIADLRREQQTMDIELKLAEENYRTLKQTTPMDRAAAERTYRNLREDTQHYFQVARGLLIKSADRMLQSAQFSLEYAQEELDQLEKMYKADDLTEETEEIIFKRARRAVDAAKFSLERQKVNHQQTLKVTIPRRDISMKDSLRRGELAWATAKLALPLALKKAELELEKLRLERKRSAEKLQKLEADRAAMTIKAPTSGVVYYGRFEQGKYSGAGSSTLREGATLAPDQVFMTIVRPRPMAIRASVPEKELRNVVVGAKGLATPTGFDDLRLRVIVSQLSPIPQQGGSFDAQISVALDEEAECLMPGMTCKVKLIGYLNKDAVTVPPKAIETDELDERKQYVYVLDKQGKPRKRPVKLGRRTDKKVEVLKGLSEGEKILAEVPKQADDSAEENQQKGPAEKSNKEAREAKPQEQS